jgi:hypothetical protein
VNTEIRKVEEPKNAGEPCAMEEVRAEGGTQANGAAELLIAFGEDKGRGSKVKATKPEPILKSENWKIVPQWNLLKDKRDEYGMAGQEWVWESRTWTPQFLSGLMAHNAWCRDEYGLESDGTAEALILKFPNDDVQELTMFHAIWVWAGILGGEKLPLMVESFVRLLGNKDTDWTEEPDTATTVGNWASLPDSYYAGLIKMMPLVFKLGMRKHLMIAIASGGFIRIGTAREVARIICDKTEQSGVLIADDYAKVYNSLHAANKPKLTMAVPKQYLPYNVSSAWAQDGPHRKHGNQSARTLAS